MNITKAELEGVVIIEPDVFGDERGYFLESWNYRRYAAGGVDRTFIQDNLSHSSQGTLRGLHFQNPNPQGKLVTVLDGEVLDVVVDLRVHSKTFGQWVGYILSGENKKQLYIPEGFAHGFLVKSETALLFYKCTEYYSKADEVSLLWNDPDLGIDWGVVDPTMSPKDKAAKPLKEIPAEKLFAAPVR